MKKNRTNNKHIVLRTENRVVNYYKYYVKFADGEIAAVICEKKLEINNIVKTKHAHYTYDKIARATIRELKDEYAKVIGEDGRSKAINKYQKAELLLDKNELEKTVEEYVEWEAIPLIIDDGYPFGYENNLEMIQLINSARLKDIVSIKKLIEIYSDKTSVFFDERKAKFWEGK